MTILSFPPNAAILWVSVLISFVLSNIAWHRRYLPGGIMLFVTLTATTIYVFSSAVEAMVIPLEAKIQWSQNQYIGLVFIAPFSHLMVRQFLRIPRPSNVFYILLFSIPVLTLSGVLTNAWHGLIWSGFSRGNPEFNILIYEHGVLFWIFMAGMYSTMFYNAVILLANYKKSDGLLKKQIIIITLGLLSPMFTGFTYLFDLGMITALDMTPAAITITGFFITLGFTRYNLFDLNPVARELIIDSLPDGVMIMNTLGLVTYINPAMNRLLGIPRSMVARNVSELSSQYPVLDMVMGQEPSKSVLIPLEKDLHINIKKNILLDKRGRTVGHMVYAHDVTSIIQVESELHEKEKESLQWQERRRLSRELHDSVTQSLHSLVFSAETAKNLLVEHSEPGLVKVATHLEVSARQALKEMRLLLYELRLAPFSEKSLSELITTRMEAVEARAGVKASLVVEDGAEWLKEWEAELYPIVMESLNNSLKYAQASRVVVSLAGKPQNFRMEIKDDGVGFDPSLVLGSGIGFQSMAERVEKLNGTLKIISFSGEGTTIRVDIQIPHSANPTG